MLQQLQVTAMISLSAVLNCWRYTLLRSKCTTKHVTSRSSKCVFFVLYLQWLTRRNRKFTTLAMQFDQLFLIQGLWESSKNAVARCGWGNVCWLYGKHSKSCPDISHHIRSMESCKWRLFRVFSKLRWSRITPTNSGFEILGIGEHAYW